MTVQELVFKLEGMPPNAVVLVPNEIKPDGKGGRDVQYARFAAVGFVSHHRFSTSADGLEYFHHGDPRAAFHIDEKAVFLA